MASAFLSRTIYARRFVSSTPISQNPQKIASVFFKKSLQLGVSPTHTTYRRLTFVRGDMATAMAGFTASFSTRSVSTSEPVVSVDWLHANLREPDLKVLDASWYMPDEQRNPLQEYQVAHIPGALLFDVGMISDQTTNLPHLLPSEEAFVAVVSALGIENKDGIVVYDGKGIFSATHVWWSWVKAVENNLLHKCVA